MEEPEKAPTHVTFGEAFRVRGGSVSQSVQQQLANNGIKTRYVEGGLEALNKKNRH